MCRSAGASVTARPSGSRGRRTPCGELPPSSRRAASSSSSSAARGWPGARASRSATRFAFARYFGSPQHLLHCGAQTFGSALLRGQPHADSRLDHPACVVWLVPVRRHDHERNACLQRRQDRRGAAGAHHRRATRQELAVIEPPREVNIRRERPQVERLRIAVAPGRENRLHRRSGKPLGGRTEDEGVAVVQRRLGDVHPRPLGRYGVEPGGRLRVGRPGARCTRRASAPWRAGRGGRSRARRGCRRDRAAGGPLKALNVPPIGGRPCSAPQPFIGVSSGRCRRAR